MENLINQVIEKLIEMGYDAEICRVKKNNGVVKTGVSVKEKGSSIASNIYLNGNEDVDAVVKACITEVKRAPKIDSDMFNWENVKNGITLALVNYDLNKDSGVCIRQIDGTDLGIIVKFLAVEGDKVNGIGFITMKPSHLHYFGISEDELFEIAENRFQNANDYKINSMFEMLHDSGMPVSPAMFIGAPSMIVVTNKDNVNGAVAMLNRNCMKELSEKFDGNFYIIPSSIHEFIAIPFDEVAKELSGFIAEVNGTMVLSNEVLSDNLFYYDANEDCIKIA